MKIGVISDTHGYVDRVALAIEKFFADADLILHAGDVLYHGPNNPNYKGDDYNPKRVENSVRDCARQRRFGSGSARAQSSDSSSVCLCLRRRQTYRRQSRAPYPDKCR